MISETLYSSSLLFELLFARFVIHCFPLIILSLSSLSLSLSSHSSLILLSILLSFQEYLACHNEGRSDVSNVSSDLSSSDNIIDPYSTTCDETSCVTDTDEVCAL